jgi:hypothetical protein
MVDWRSAFALRGSGVIGKDEVRRRKVFKGKTGLTG